MMKAETIFLCYKKELEINALWFSVALCITMIYDVTEILILIETGCIQSFIGKIVLSVFLEIGWRK